MIKTLYQTSDGKTFSTLQKAEEHEARKRYTVTYTLEGSVCVSVWAKDEKEAKRLACDEWYPEDINWEITSVEAEAEEG